MSKFLKVKISKTLYTDLYIEVPDDFDEETALLPELPEPKEQLAKAAAKSTLSCDWDNHEWAKTVEAIEVEEVTKHVAEEYPVFLWQQGT